MRRVYYAGGSFLTGDAIASAILGYADALTRTHSSDLVSFPVVQPLGDIGEVALLVGPASQMATATESSLFDDPIDHDLVEMLERKMLTVGARKPLLHGMASPGVYDELY